MKVLFARIGFQVEVFLNFRDEGTRLERIRSVNMLEEWQREHTTLHGALIGCSDTANKGDE